MAYGIIKKYKFLRNRTELLSIIDSFIDIFEKEIKQTHYCDSCKEILMIEIKKEINSDPVGVSLLDKHHDNFSEIAVATISSVSFEFFEYSRFRSGGQYSNMRYASKMMWRMHYKAIQWGFDHGYVTKEELEEDKLAFEEVLRIRV